MCFFFIFFKFFCKKNLGQCPGFKFLSQSAVFKILISTEKLFKLQLIILILLSI